MELLYRYSVGIIRAIEEAYRTAYQNGIEVYQRGISYVVKNPFSIAEYLVDFEMGCKSIGRIPGRGRMNYKECQRIVEFLNGERN